MVIAAYLIVTRILRVIVGGLFLKAVQMAVLGCEQGLNWCVRGVVLHFYQIIAVQSCLLVLSGFQKFVEILEVVSLDQLPDLTLAVLEN